ncbi:MAG: hypothetical protein HFG32_13955 [Eubacterium sp.]|nr:hypothetical protein [Eubacterium sp.]
MKIGLKKPRTDLAIKHIMLIIDGKEYYISFHYSLRKGIKDVRVYGEPVKVINAYPAFPDLVRICAADILIDLKFIVLRIVDKMKDHNRLNGHK